MNRFLSQTGLNPQSTQKHNYVRPITSQQRIFLFLGHQTTSVNNWLRQGLGVQDFSMLVTRPTREAMCFFVWNSFQLLLSTGVLNYTSQKSLWEREKQTSLATAWMLIHHRADSTQWNPPVGNRDRHKHRAIVNHHQLTTVQQRCTKHATKT